MRVRRKPRFTRVYHTKLPSCRTKLFNQFTRLNLGRFGTMKHMLNDIDNRNSSYVFYILDSNGEVAAWAISGILKDTGRLICYYTRFAYRRRGLGTRLANYITRHHSKYVRDECIIIGNESRSVSFFDQCIKKQAINKQIKYLKYTSLPQIKK